MLPANASAVNLCQLGRTVTLVPQACPGKHWPYTFLAFSPKHPIIQRHVERITSAVLAQARAILLVAYTLAGTSPHTDTQHAKYSPRTLSHRSSCSRVATIFRNADYCATMRDRASST